MSLAALEAITAGSRCAARWPSEIGTAAKVFSPKGVDMGRRLVSAGWTSGGIRRNTSMPRIRPTEPPCPKRGGEKRVAGGSVSAGHDNPIDSRAHYRQRTPAELSPERQ
jgi:hypothetical protein